MAVLVFFGLSGYRTATASDFFKVRAIEIYGNEKTPTEDIRRIVASETEKPGVWNVDLADIRARIEKFTFVRSAAVSRVLPAGIRVNVTERVKRQIEMEHELLAAGYHPAQSSDRRHEHGTWFGPDHRRVS